jgi:hypothetical protein
MAGAGPPSVQSRAISRPAALIPHCGKVRKNRAIH